MKAGIVTFNSAHNYGAVLQAWSLQTWLEKKGYQADIINLRPWVIDDVYAMAKKKNIFGNTTLNTLANKARIAKNCLADRPKYKRYQAFEEFINHKLHTTKVYRKGRELQKEKGLKYDALIAGSDQIWNSSLTKGIDPAYFLAFGPLKARRISYAASIGRKELPEKEKEIFAHYLEQLDFISVRENNAYKAISELTPKEVKIVADPTFLLDREDFDFLKEEFPVKQPYIYVHNVHLARNDVRLNEVAEKLSKQTGLPIVSNRKEKFFSNEAEKFLTGTPEQFIGVISKAEYVVTNSFHATVFAVIYHRNFITIPHFSNPDRMINLLTELEIENHLIGNARSLPEDLKELAIDYDRVEVKKGRMREESECFLQNALTGPIPEKDPVIFDGINIADKKWLKQGKEKPDRMLASVKEKHRYQEDTMADLLAVLAEPILQKGGKLAFSACMAGGHAGYILTEDAGELRRALLPEPYAADGTALFAEIKDALDSGTAVIYAGNACRLAALKEYLRKDFEQLYLVETVCHGHVQKEVADRYLKELGELYQSELKKVEYNNKFRKPEEYFTVCQFESGAVKVEDVSEDIFRQAIDKNMILENYCYKCKLRHDKSNVADISIGLLREYDITAMKEKNTVFNAKKESALLHARTKKGKYLIQQTEEQTETAALDAKEYELVPITMREVKQTAEQMLKEKNSVQEALDFVLYPKKKR
ncbi:MAG: hypothetical protein HFG80_08190 [Eubacterium sp.]|nr:hypothetical protein [Eubacterium sp.]